jgi:hypothetical protein
LHLEVNCTLAVASLHVPPGPLNGGMEVFSTLSDEVGSVTLPDGSLMMIGVLFRPLSQSQQYYYLTVTHTHNTPRSTSPTHTHAFLLVMIGCLSLSLTGSEKRCSCCCVSDLARQPFQPRLSDQLPLSECNPPIIERMPYSCMYRASACA